ncbi:hypothetical protein BN2475_1410001 [Paraburkholderia ribeironis]|uniref:Uncharacterized protein n=1 Tax=Paraburkholderia ribeironis TaxID=1247936 RepID=A0A1N7SQ75_9BURK|nr:hypothetical protein BN2475_1410001 [Paraburkholderia ribeironis]
MNGLWVIRRLAFVSRSCRRVRVSKMTIQASVTLTSTLFGVYEDVLLRMWSRLIHTQCGR